MEQETLFEVKSALTYDMYKKFFVFSLFRKKSYKRRLTLVYIMSSIGILAALYSGISFGFDTIIVVVLLILLVLVSLMSYLVLFAPKNYYKTAKHLLENLTTYKFTLECIAIESKAKLVNGNSSIRYDAFHKIYELDDVFYLFINSRQAHLIPKTDIPIEILEQLRTIFKSKLDKKYLNYSNK